MTYLELRPLRSLNNMHTWDETGSFDILQNQWKNLFHEENKPQIELLKAEIPH